MWVGIVSNYFRTQTFLKTFYVYYYSVYSEDYLGSDCTELQLSHISLKIISSLKQAITVFFVVAITIYLKLLHAHIRCLKDLTMG